MDILDIICLVIFFFFLFLIWVPSWEGEIMTGQFAWVVKIKVLIINSFICFEMVFCGLKNAMVSGRVTLSILSFYFQISVSTHAFLTDIWNNGNVPRSSVNFCFHWSLNRVYSILYRFCIKAALLFLSSVFPILALYASLACNTGFQKIT